jgi:hypothetical protein
VERKRQWNSAQLAKDQELRAKLELVEYLSLEEARAMLCPGEALPPRKAQGARRFDVEFPASLIDARYEGWLVILRVSMENPNIFVQFGQAPPGDITMVRSWDVVPPAKLPDEIIPPGWWIVERARVIGIWLAVIAWITGILLIVLVRGIRRKTARFCLAAALFCMLASAQDVSFGKRALLHPWNRDRKVVSIADSPEVAWKKAIADHPAWFDFAAAMTLIALLLSLIPSSSMTTGKYCPTCRYDLTGNESGICPECGTPTPKARRRQRLAELTPLADQLEHIDAPVIFSEDFPVDSAVPPE